MPIFLYFASLAETWAYSDLYNTSSSESLLRTFYTTISTRIDHCYRDGEWQTREWPVTAMVVILHTLSCELHTCNEANFFTGLSLQAQWQVKVLQRRKSEVAERQGPKILPMRIRTCFCYYSKTKLEGQAKWEAGGVIAHFGVFGVCLAMSEKQSYNVVNRLQEQCRRFVVGCSRP